MILHNFLQHLRSAVEKSEVSLVRDLILTLSRFLSNPSNGDHIRVLAAAVENSTKLNLFELLANYSAPEDSRTQDNLQKHLSNAIFDGDVRLAEFFLRSGVQLGGLDWDGKFMPSFRRILDRSESRLRMLKLLVRYGLDARLRGEKGPGIFYHLATCAKGCGAGAAEIAEVLIDSGVSIHEVDSQGHSPLIYFIAIRNAPLVSLFIHRGADVNQKNEETGRFPLIFAVADRKNDDIVDLLVSSGARINEKTNTSSTSLHAACFYNRQKVIDLLIHKGADISATSKDGFTPFSQMNNKKSRNYDGSMRAMVREFSRRAFENAPVYEMDLNLIRENSKTQGYFDACTAELKRMATTKFYGAYSYYFVLKSAKEIKKLALLAKNEEFMAGFGENLDAFPCYKSKLQTILNEAVEERDRQEMIALRLFSVFGDFLPDLVLRNLALNLNVEDLPQNEDLSC